MAGKLLKSKRGDPIAVRFIDHICRAGLRRWGWGWAGLNWAGVDPLGQVFPPVLRQRGEEEPQQAWDSTGLSMRNAMDSFCSSGSHELLSMLNTVIIVWYGFVLIPCYL